MRSAASASLFAVVLLAALLAGCAHGPPADAGRFALPAVPDRYRACFAGVVDLPPGAWSAAVTAKVAADLRVSELGKDSCGRDFLEWYGDVRAGRAPKD